MEPKPYKDRGWAWVVVFGAFLIHFLTAGSEKAYSVWYVEILEKYSANATWAASIGAISASVRLILGPLAVALCKRFTVQSVVIAGGLINSFGLLISAFSENIYTILFGYGLVYGFGLTLIFTPALVICTTYFEKRRATALSLSLTGAGVGALTLPQLVVFLLKSYSYRGAMIIMSGVTLHYCISGALFFTPPNDGIVEDMQSKRTRVEKIRSDPGAGRRCGGLRTRFAFLDLLSDFWFTLFVSSFIFNMMGSGPVTMLIIHYTEDFGIEVNISVLLLAVEGGVQVFARGLSGVLFDLACVKSHRGVVWCCIIIASSAIVCLLSVAKSLPIMVVLMALRGLCLAVYISHQTLMTCDMCEKSSGLVPHAIGLTQFFKGVGILVGSAISGRIKDVSGYYEGAFIFLGVAQFFGSLMALTAIVHRKYACSRPAGVLGEADLDGAIHSLLLPPNGIDADLILEDENSQKVDVSTDCLSDGIGYSNPTFTQEEVFEKEHVHPCPI
uniref:Monocarboxylate transporter 12 n=1 Tax=Schistocephalus solidus TaxID=70667 RepID=A0A0X3PH48_SCHSO